MSLQVLNHPESTQPIFARLLEYLRREDQMGHYVGKLLVVESYRIRVRQ